jgi:tRNA (cytidine/uridine-2'-O-)-methyltransferase
MINLVLLQPEIPHNTGAIGRTCVCLNANLHLIKPLGFHLTDKYIKRAGMDYWPFLNVTIHDSWNDFLESEKPSELSFASTKGNKTYFEHSFKDDEYVVFGAESSGLPNEFYEEYREQLITIPMPGEHARSLNLANSASIIAYEAYRQLLIN